ncbi:sck1 [Symbiodinium microadriaticum]|nr:sck1 [Symbiodinium microadriaticum]
MGSLSATLSIHDFDLIKVLGQGSFGKVFLVRPVGAPPEEVYAMKALKKAEVEKRKQVDHTMAERRIMAIMRSPFVLKLRYAFQTPHKLYMVTDYCSGGELFFHLKKMRRFSESMMRFYTAELSLALHHLHSQNIIYRDMKPENVLLDRFGHVKLTDFGLSKVLTAEVGPDGTRRALYATTFCGTPEYLAPELIQHRRHNTGYGIDIDWWSLGIVAFELLTGWPPFFDKDFDRMCEKILKKPIRFPGKYSISAEAQQLIRGFLERNPNNRLGSRKSGGLGSLQAHVFFADTEWDLLERGQVRPPFVPLSGGDPADTRNFDSEFTKMAVKDLGGASGSAEDGQASILDYEGFSFLDDEYKQLRQRSRDLADFEDEDAQQEGMYLDES